MKIDSYHSQSVTKEQAVPAAAKTDETKSSPSINSGSASEDLVTLSSISLLTNKLQTASENRIQELKRQISAGTYSVDAAQLSRKLVSSMLEE